MLDGCGEKKNRHEREACYIYLVAESREQYQEKQRCGACRSGGDGAGGEVSGARSLTEGFKQVIMHEDHEGFLGQVHPGAISGEAFT